VLPLEWGCKDLVENQTTVDLSQELTHRRNERQTRKVGEHKVWVLENGTSHSSVFLGPWHHDSKEIGHLTLRPQCFRKCWFLLAPCQR
jgi:hypothetical protein